MPKIFPLQQSFAGGEITPRLVGQVNNPVRQTGLSRLENMSVLTQGPTSSRGGSGYLDDAADPIDIRMIPFNLAVKTDYALALTPGVLRIYNSVGRVDAGSLTYIKDGFFTRGGTFWTETESGSGVVSYQAADFSCSLIREGGGGAEAIIDQAMAAIPTAEIGDPHQFTGQVSGDGTLHVNIGTTKGDNDILNQDIAPGLFIINVTPTTEQLYIEFSNDAQNSVATIGRIRFRLPGTDIEIVTPYTAEELPDIQYEMITAEGYLILVHNNHHPKTLNINPDLTWTFQDAPFNYDETTPPGDPIWQEGDYPGVVTVYEGRLWLGRTTSEKQRLWGSNSGTFFDFYTSGTPVDSDKIDFTLAMPGEIEWLQGQKELLMGTDVQEYLLTSVGGVITPTDVDLRAVSAHGSARLVQSVLVGDQVAYISPDRRKLRMVTFKRENEWFSPDITWRAEHLTLNDRIIEIHYDRDPESLIVLVTDTGKLFICTYQREQEVIGWARHFNIQARLVSACVVTTPLGSQIFVAEKLSNGTMAINVMSADSNIGNIMDNAILVTPTVVGGNDVLTGLDSMEGMEVVIKIDGAIHPPQVVGADGPQGPATQPGVPGQVYLQFTGDIAVAGLGFLARMQTLPFDVGAPGGDGSGYIKHWNKIIVRVQDSAKVIVNGHRNPERFPSTPMNLPQPALTEDIPVATLGRDRLGLVTIEQDLPLDLTVISLFGEISQEALG